LSLIAYSVAGHSEDPLVMSTQGVELIPGVWNAFKFTGYNSSLIFQFEILILKLKKYVFPVLNEALNLYYIKVSVALKVFKWH